MKRLVCILLIVSLHAGWAFAGIDIVRGSGMFVTGANGVNIVGPAGITLTGADSLLTYRTNGITLTGADGQPIDLANQTTSAGPDAAGYAGPNGITLTGADGITLTGADGITLTGADGVTLTAPSGTTYSADSVLVRRTNGITLTGADGITLTGADGVGVTGPNGSFTAGPSGITLTGADGITLTGADGITLTGADGAVLSQADSVTGFNTAGVAFDLVNPAGLAVTRASGITLTGADGITLTGADDIVFRNVDGITLTGADDTGLQSVDPELAVTLNSVTDDSSVNAVVVFHDAVTENDLARLRQIGINGGTRFRVLPMIYVTGTKSQILAVSRLSSVRSIYGNRTLNFDIDPYFNRTNAQRVAPDADLRTRNNGLPFTGRNVTVAVLDTGVNSLHPDLAGKVVQNVRLLDTQSLPTEFLAPLSIENVADTDPVAGHGTFVAGVIAGTGARSARFAGVAPGANILGLSAGDINLVHVLSGFDYLLDRGAAYGVRVVNCSFSANTVYDTNDPVNIATKMLTDNGVSVVVSAGNSGPGNGTLNPYAAAPWVIGVGATDENGTLAPFSSRGNFGADQQPTLSAPGVNVASIRSLPTMTSISGLGGADLLRLSILEMPYYTTASGTSFSAPQVAGAIALMTEADPSLTPAQIKAILSRTATPLPKYFYHEVGAGMLNTYAAVLNAAFPDRRLGLFRSTISRNGVRFTTATSQTFSDQVSPGTARTFDLSVPSGTIQSGVHVSWGFGANDLGLKLFDGGGNLLGESNYLNLPGLTGRREEVVLRAPAVPALRASVQHTGGVGTTQIVDGAMEITTVQYPTVSDVSSADAIDVQKCMLANLMFSFGDRFRPDSVVSRADLASVMVRGGFAPLYLGASPMFADVRDISTRNIVESAQSNPGGRLIYDASAGGLFYPNNSALRLASAVAFVRAAGLESLTTTATLPSSVLDVASIPLQWRGHVAVALQRGFLTTSAYRFEPNRPLTRIELARAVNAMLR